MPPALAIAGWSLFSYSDGIHFLDPSWDAIAFSTFVVLLAFFLLIPLVLLPPSWTGRAMTDYERHLAPISSAGLAFAWLLLLIGFLTINWQWSFTR
ncbi:hypothetical protein EON83_30500 [bacterium]|nr:MAG: hypothetical protein EON83_30500 [bacterium]